MRMQFLIAATLAACACNHAAEGCPPGPEGDPFDLAVDLDTSTVQDLLTAANQSDPAKLVCSDVCTSLYGDDSPDLIITQIDTCKLMVDGDLMGDPAAIIGSLQCEGYSSETICVGGRRPLGHVELPPGATDLPTFLAQCAHLEAASVVAFAELADRLARWGAPPELVARCRHAAREESDHAALLGALAREAGATVAAAAQQTVAVDLARTALDNAIEGCVHEAWSALACAATARHAQDPRLRAVYARLAADEAGHAQLAWDLHTWFMGQVSADQRASIRAAQRAAIAGLPALARAQSMRAPTALAFPDARAAAHFAAGLARAA